MELAINAKIEMTDTCWNWQGTLDSNGTTPKYSTTRKYKKINIPVRRYIYETLVGEIPEGRMVKSNCGNGKCVNPEHTTLDSYQKHIRAGQAPRKRKEQCAAITHCPHGHEYSGYNLITGVTYKKVVMKDGTVVKHAYPSRWCRTCINTRNQQARMRKSQSVQRLKVS